jgi:hypothetical protein
MALQTFHQKDGKNRFVSAMGWDYDWVLYGETIVLDDYEKFTIINVDTQQPWECSDFVKTLEKEGEVIVALQTFHLRYVTAMDANWGMPWVLRAETNVIDKSEMFTFILLADQ